MRYVDIRDCCLLAMLSLNEHTCNFKLLYRVKTQFDYTWWTESIEFGSDEKFLWGFNQDYKLWCCFTYIVKDSWGLSKKQ